MRPLRRIPTVLAALSASLALAVPLVPAQQAGDDAQVRKDAVQQVRAGFQKALGAGVDDLSEKGRQDLDTLVKNMGAGQRQAARGELEKLAAQAKDPAAKAEIAKAYAALSRHAKGEEAAALAREAVRLGSNDPEALELAKAAAYLPARDTSPKGGDREIVAPGSKPQPAIFNNIIINLDGTQAGRRVPRGALEFREDKTGRLKDTIVDSAWEGEGAKRHLVVNFDSTALQQNKKTPGTLAPFLAKVLEKENYLKEHGNTSLTRLEAAVSGWMTAAQVGDELIAQGDGQIDTQKSTAGRTVLYFVDLYHGAMKTDYTPLLNGYFFINQIDANKPVEWRFRSVVKDFEK